MSAKERRREEGGRERTLVTLELGKNAEGVGAEVVTLSLEEGSGETLGAVTVEEGESGGEGRGRDTPESTLGDDTAPSGLGLVDCEEKERVSECAGRRKGMNKERSTY
jgi:hypothetical protein